MLSDYDINLGIHCGFESTFCFNYPQPKSPVLHTIPRVARLGRARETGCLLSNGPLHLDLGLHHCGTWFYPTTLALPQPSNPLPLFDVAQYSQLPRAFPVSDSSSKCHFTW